MNKLRAETCGTCGTGLLRVLEVNRKESVEESVQE